jgi:predicted phage baseplate assembly protein
MNENCDCCAGTDQITPEDHANRPGLDALAYRVGTHGSFLQTMKARLSSTAYPPLAGLTTREAYDASIALLDAWAIVADVLTFYQERIAVEGFLRTAVERRSILELGRLVGYALRPGVASSVFLAYTLDDGHEASIAVGTRAQSIPTPGHLPQTFETADPLEARAAWNLLHPRPTRPQLAPDAQITDTRGKPFYLQGLNVNLKPNDPLLIDVGATHSPPVAPRFYRVVEVQPDPAANRVMVALQSWRRERVAFRVAPDQDFVPLTAWSAATAGGEAVPDVITRYRDLESFAVSPDSRMANRVLSALNELEADPAPATRQAILAQLRAEHALARDRNYSVLEPWLAGLVADLAAAGSPGERIAEPGERDLAVQTMAVGARAGQNGRAANNGFSVGQLIAPLQRNPSIPPPNTLRLARNIKTTFRPESDIGPQIIGTLDARLKKTLYAAWAHAVVTPPSEIDGVSAFRVQASPFGYNAPLRPIYGPNNVIEGSEEWPLYPLFISITLSTTQDAQERLLIQASIVLQWGATSAARRVTLHTNNPPEFLSFRLGEMQVEIDNEFGSNSGSSITFDFLDPTVPGTPPRRSILISWESDIIGLVRMAAAASGLFVSVNDDTGSPHRVLDGRHRYIVDEHRTLTLDVDDDGLVILDESADMVPEQLRNVVALDAVYDKITAGSWVVIDRPALRRAVSPPDDGLIFAQVESVRTVTIANYGITGRVTELTLQDTPWLFDDDRMLTVLRNTTIFAQSEALAVAEVPLDPLIDQICGNTVELDALYDGLQSGRWLIVRGERTDLTRPPAPSGVFASELVMLAAVTQGATLPGDSVHTTIQFAEPLAFCYKRDTVTIYGNVVRATHGETRTEVLGSGDGSRALQQFRLRQSPLTYLPAPTPAGAESTLVVRVNDVRWHETDTLAGLGHNDRYYITQTDNEDKTTVIFGDGEHGARPPTGSENITAVYRTGIGKPGNVEADQISLLVSRPLGVRSVINPLPATGGADREAVAQARRNVPLGVLALDRLVSVQDYADFARTFAGIGKANAVRLSDGRREVVYLTIAGADDIPIAPTSDLYQALYLALRRAGDPYQAVDVVLRELLLLVISARIQLLPDYLWESVVSKVRGALLDTFSFMRRDLGQDVLLGEVISAMQAVEGVAYVDVDVLGGIPEKIVDPVTRQRRTPSPEEIAAAIARLVDDAEENGPLPRLAVNGAGADRSGLHPAQLAYLTPDVPDTLILTEITT